jgi:hypothetical protein
MGEVALWYWRYNRMDYGIWDSEEEAAGIAVAMADDGGGSTAGVQFPDGRLIPCDEWAAYAEAERAREQAWHEAVQEEPRPQREITAPFGGGKIKIGADEPAWLGER